MIAGRRSTFASALVKSVLRTGGGPTQLTGPAMSSRESRNVAVLSQSRIEIQGIHCRPLARRPPTKSRNVIMNGRISPPRASSGSPVRRYTTRTPASSAAAVAPSQAWHSSGKYPVPGGVFSSIGSSPRSP